MNGYNRNGGLTLIPMNGFVNLAREVQIILKEKGEPIKADLAIPKYGFRSNGEPFIRLAKDHIGGHDCVVITSGPGTPEMLTFLFLLLGYLKGRRAGRITVISAYFPLSRSDKDEGDLELALTPHIVHLMKAASYGDLNRIIVVDPHCLQIPMAAGEMGLVTPVSLMRRLLYKVVQLARQENGQVCVHFPDGGAADRFEDILDQVADELDVDLPRTFGSKRRKNSKECNVKKIWGDVQALDKSLAIVVDDEAATMGTMDKSAGELKKKYGVHLFWALLVHPILCGQAPELLDSPDCKIDKMIAAGTVHHERPELEAAKKSGRLIIMPWVDDLANIIRFHHKDMNIRGVR